MHAFVAGLCVGVVAGGAVVYLFAAKVVAKVKAEVAAIENKAQAVKKAL